MKLYTHIAKVFFAAVSAGGGYFFMENLLADADIDRWLKISIAVTVLIFLEAGTMLFLREFFGRFGKGKVLHTAAFGFIAILFLFVSFLFTGFGTANRAAITSDNSLVITAEFETKSARLSAGFEYEKDSLVSALAAAEKLVADKSAEPKHFRKTGIEQQGREFSVLAARADGLRKELTECKRTFADKNENLKRRQNTLLAGEKRKHEKHGNIYFLAAFAVTFFIFVFNWLSVFLKKENLPEQAGRTPVAKKSDTAAKPLFSDAEKRRLAAAMHIAAGRPLTKEKIAERFAGQTGSGINRFARFIKEKTKTDFSESTVKSVVSLVCAADAGRISP